MRTLRLVALSDDGKDLILAEEVESGERFALPVDDRVRAAARGDARRLGQIDVEAANALPPRVIQARIRSGETPEDVASATGTSVERIMRFAHPVLQERARVAEQAREARVRLSEGTPGSPLQRFMSERLRLIGGGTEIVRWDAHRAEDGGWMVTAAWRTGAKSGTTLWGYDLPSRTVSPADAATTDFAEGTRLVRVVPEVPAGAAAPPSSRARSIAVLRENVRREGGTGSADSEDEHVTEALHLDGEQASRDGAVPGESLDAEYLDAIAEHDTVVLGRGEDLDSEDPRVRVPAWEDIVFGVRRNR